MRRALCLLCLVLTACTSPAEPPVGGAGQALVGDGSTVLPWGSGPGQVGLRPRGHEILAEGPSALAVSSDGAVLVLDRRNGRVLRVGAGGQVSVAARVPLDSEDLAAAPRGGLATFSPLRSRVWLRDGRGEPAGELAVPRLFRQVRRVGLGASLEVTLHDAHQETYRLGSPSAALSLEAALSSRREGAFLLSDGTGVAVQLRQGLPELLRLGHGPRVRVVGRHLLPRRALAARVVGVAGGAVCLRTEHDHPARAREIRRRVVCLDPGSGRLMLDRQLPAPGLYLPRRELALGGDPARLALIHPGPRGLRVQTWRVGR